MKNLSRFTIDHQQAIQAGVLLVAVCSAATAFSSDFTRDVFPILRENCLGCHDRETRDGGVGLDNFHQAHLPTDGGEQLFVSGKPEKSVLLKVLSATDPKHRMPLDEAPLPAEQIDTIRKWITEGAEWPDDGWRPEVHWSFRKPERSTPAKPTGRSLAHRNANEVDAFIASRLRENGLQLNPEAKPARLLRRIFLDVTGLPPTIAQVDDFIADPSFSRYQSIVDQLLASPAYGEKWAIPWLDLARYADSEGYQRDSPRSMWPWRDWVINALNEDMPFDQFTIEQLAGDLLPDASESQIVATGFHRNAATNLEAGTDPSEDRYKVIVDRVNTTGTVWLGLTVGCAQCHNHKYDPITAKDYYQLFAFFNTTPMETKQQGSKMGMSGLVAIGPTINATLTESDKTSIQHARNELAEFLKPQEFAIRAAMKVVATNPTKKDKKTAANVLKLLQQDTAWSLTECQKVVKLIPAGQAAAIKQQLAIAQIMNDRMKLQKEKSVRVMKDLEESQATFVARRGDFMSHGQQVLPATPDSLHEFPSSLPRNRLGLAQWLVSEENPLVARAFVNRLWGELFGKGLVQTPDDFGKQGLAPTHPELLDWLAVTFMKDDQWSMKNALRRIVLSATYRQSVVAHVIGAEKNPRNDLYWKHPGHRLKAELIRDQALAISGLLCRDVGGIHVRPYQPPTFWRKTAGAGEDMYLPSTGKDAYRRGLYTLWRRNAHYPGFANFDAPDRSACVIQRDSSNTPLQALTLLNDRVYVEAATAFGRRIQSEAGATLDQKVQWAFRTALSRAPNEGERSILKSAFEQVLQQTGSEKAAARELATIILNLHETIHRS